ncbi:hypothetical protein RRG08_002167 [Elysia crispata]|uniref:Ig-like domain-containing protein n=1 Tax=Elysia crispata TaxID=231223 RepID=A0AAE0ZBM0_9GAST|nr:hypothetical protein RRG08_002167 [Elysia crispata]
MCGPPQVVHASHVNSGMQRDNHQIWSMISNMKPSAVSPCLIYRLLKNPAPFNSITLIERLTTKLLHASVSNLQSYRGPRKNLIGLDLTRPSIKLVAHPSREPVSYSPRNGSDPVTPSIVIESFSPLRYKCVSLSASRPARYIVPKFVNTPNNVTAVVGSDVILPCSIENLGPKTVIWRKVNKPSPIAVGDYVFDPDKQYTLDPPDMFADPRIRPSNSHYHHGSSIKRKNLMVTDVTFEHAGIYQCVISTKEDIVRNVTLNVVEDRHSRMKPKKTGIQLTGTHYVEKGSDIDLNCTATAIDYRPKGLDWFKDGTRLKQGGRRLITDQYMGEASVVHSRLEIQRATMNDAGTYVCRFSQLHVRDIKVIVLNKWPSKLPRSHKLADSSNKRRDMQNTQRTGTEGLEIERSDGHREEDYYGTIRGENSHRRSKEDTGSAFSSSLVLTIFLVLVALVWT